MPRKDRWPVGEVEQWMTLAPLSIFLDRYPSLWARAGPPAQAHGQSENPASGVRLTSPSLLSLPPMYYVTSASHFSETRFHAQ